MENRKKISRVRLAILGFSKLIFNIQQIEYQVEKRCRVSERAYSKK
jgi:hypothetical protein